MLTREAKVAWAAGFIDGEGSITLMSVNSKRAYSVLLEATNRDVAALERLRELFGGTFQVHTRGNALHATTLKWRLFAANACRAIAELYPYLVVKQEQARLALIWQTTVDSKDKFDKVDDEFLDVRARCLTKMRDLNKRGPRAVRSTEVGVHAT